MYEEILDHGQNSRLEQRFQLMTKGVFVVAVLILMTLPLYVNPYYIYFIQIVSVYAIVAMGLNLLAGYSGLLMAGQAAIFAASAYTFTLLVKNTGVPYPIAAVAGICASGVVGLLLGVPSLRLSDFYLAMVTLGFAIAIFDLLLEWADLTGGWSGVYGIPSPKIGPLVLKDEPLYIVVLLVLLGLIWLTGNIRRSKWGRAFFLVRDSEIAAESMAISGYRTKLLSFLLCSLFAGIGGVLYPLTARSISPFVFDLQIAVFFLLCIIIGGMGTILGPIFGVAILMLLPEILEGYQSVANVIYAAIVIAILALAPEGLAGGFLKLKERWIQPDRDAARGQQGLPEHIEILENRFRVPDEPGGLILAVERLSKSFGGVMAVNDVNMNVRSGGIHSIIGPNGSGKTTFFNLISGFYPPESGHIVFRDNILDRKSPVARAEMGIGRTFQTPKVAGELDVLENVMLGFNMHLRALVMESMIKLPRSRREERMIRERSMDILKLTGLEVICNEKAKKLPHGYLRMLEIARVIASEPHLIMLDEPAAGLNHDEIDHLEKVIRAIVATGCCVLLVEHHMGLVMRLADKITVFDYGRKIAEGTPEDIQKSEKVMDAYLGQQFK